MKSLNFQPNIVSTRLDKEIRYTAWGIALDAKMLICLPSGTETAMNLSDPLFMIIRDVGVVNQITRGKLHEQ